MSDSVVTQDETESAETTELDITGTQQVLTYLVTSLVQEPDEVSIKVEHAEGKVSFYVHVAAGDMGRVIGKRGRVAQSIRTVVRAAASRDGVHIDVEFVD